MNPLRPSPRVWTVFVKTLREQSRDLLSLGLVLLSAPLFVLLYWLWFPSGSTTYGVLVVSYDQPAAEAGTPLDGAAGVFQALQEVSYADGNPLLEVAWVSSREAAEPALKDRTAEVLMIIPEGFSRSLLAARAGRLERPAEVTLSGDLTNPYYAVGAIFAASALDAYIQTVTLHEPPVRLVEEPLGASGGRSEFETYVPGLLIFAVMMLIFPAAMTLTHEAETGALRRLQITRMTAFDLLGGVSAAMALIGLASVGLTFWVAQAFGFHSQGPVWVAVLAGGVASLSMISAGMIVACFARTGSQAFLIANFPLMLFMFFSGAIYPVPRIELFSLGGHAFGVYDLLPPTHAVVALNKIMTMGAGLGEVSFELAALLVLSLAYFAAGVWLYRRTHLKAR